LLFCLFIDRLEAWLDKRLPECGVTLGAEKLRLLLYADDLTLLAASPEELQALLDCLQTFCDRYQLHVNVAKCVVVVFGRRKPCPAKYLLPDGWQYAGQNVPCVSEFRYLGIVFHETKGVSAYVATAVCWFAGYVGYTGAVRRRWGGQLGGAVV
jgi:hypothetical protein